MKSNIPWGRSLQTFRICWESQHDGLFLIFETGSHWDFGKQLFSLVNVFAIVLCSEIISLTLPIALPANLIFDVMYFTVLLHHLLIFYGFGNSKFNF